MADEQPLTSPSAGTSPSGTYLETLPKDVIGYLRGFTGPDQLYQIRYRHRKEKRPSIYDYYYMYATSKKVRDDIEKIIANLPQTTYANKFYRIFGDRPIYDVMYPYNNWDDPFEIIEIGGKLKFIIPVKDHMPEHIFSSTQEFKRKTVNVRTIKNKKCSTDFCNNKCPKELDLCSHCQYRKLDRIAKKKIAPRLSPPMPSLPVKKPHTFVSVRKPHFW